MENDPLNERYDGLCITSLLDLTKINERNLQYLKPDEHDSPEYLNLAAEINRLDLVINAFENFITWCDEKHEMAGVSDFPIDMPREFFRFPCFNNSNDRFHCSPISSEEAHAINRVIESARPVFRVRNDENIIREQICRLEFVSLFAFFEAFLEDLHFRFLVTTGDRKVSVDYLRRNHLADSFSEIAQAISKDILPRLEKIFPSFLKALHYLYLLRNIHMHKLGSLSHFALQKGLDYGSIEKEEIEIESQTHEEYRPAFAPLADRNLRVGEYVPLRYPANLLRIIFRETGHITNHYAKDMIRRPR